jgi:dolichyl-phosphate-mannose--protein O-mannosyl transferase
MDADLSHDPADIARLLERAGDADVVVGSRYVSGGSAPGFGFLRSLLSRFGNGYARKILRLPVKDATSGFIAYRATLLRQILAEGIRSTGFAFQIEMKHRLWRRGAKFAEVPITFGKRLHGASKLSLRIILEGLIAPWRLRAGKPLFYRLSGAAFSKEDFMIGLVLLLSALLLRVPYFSHPESVVFDEGVISSFVTNVVRREPFFEPHPPLGWMALRLAAPELTESAPFWSSSVVQTLYQDFPYRKFRLFNIFIGSFIPLGLFITARLLGFSRYLSLIPAVFAVMDNALIFYSRFILPETLLLALGVAGVAVAAALLRVTLRLATPLLAATSGILLGLSGAVKLTGFGFLFAVTGMLVAMRRWKFIPLLAVAAAGAYFSVFVIYFGSTRAGPVNFERGFYRSAELERIQFPGAAPVLERLRSAVAYSRAMVSVHQDPKSEAVVGARRGSPARWPLSMAPMRVWSAPQNLREFIVLTGNPFTWILGFGAVLTLLVSAARGLWDRIARRIPRGSACLRGRQAAGVGRTNFISGAGCGMGWNSNLIGIFLLFAYLINYIPFFFIGRPMFLYHYLPALLFSFLAVPAAIRALWSRFGRADVPFEKVERALFWTVFVFSSLTFLSISPMTYGF